MKLKIKVCGMREPDNIAEVINLRPDFMGFIFYEKSPRYVGHDFVLPTMDHDVARVGVFVNHSYEFIQHQAMRYALHYVQLHGDESVEFCTRLQQAGLKIIKVFGVDEQFNFDIVEPYQSVAKYFLFDTKTGHYGGSGKVFDWSILAKYALNTPFFLSGGINLENVETIRKLNNSSLYAVDINSGAEEIPGRKDIQKLKAIFSHLNRN